MARKKSYDRDQAVGDAMRTFWTRGYSNLGVREIERETALNRFALQTEFGGKQGLFLEALECYLALSRDGALKPLGNGGLQGIRDFFTGLVAPGDDAARDKGCLMVNTVIENADLSLAPVRQMTDAHYDGMRQSFQTALERAVTDGELPAGFDSEAGAAFLLTFAMGIEVYIRMNDDVSAARAQVDFLLTELDRWAAGN